jgi:hypothetical protein
MADTGQTAVALCCFPEVNSVGLSSEISRIYGYGRGRQIGWVRTQLCIREIAHLKLKDPAFDDVSVAKPDLMQGFSVEPDRLNVLIVL